MDDFGRDDPRAMPRHLFFGAVRLDVDTAVRADTGKQNCSICPRYWYVDATFRCERCGDAFVFSAAEQREWYEAYGFWVDSLPKHCLGCRRDRRRLKALRQDYDRSVAAVVEQGDLESRTRLAEVIDRLYELGGALPPRIHETRRRLANQIAAARRSLPADVPATVRTARLLLRPWMAADAAALQPILERNAGHLGPWIPARVAAPAPLAELSDRLQRFADDFAAGRGFRYALLSSDGARLLGEADLFPRAASGRVPLRDADHVEIGYWLDAAETGRGLATEAAGALLDVASALAGIAHVEIRCETENPRSAAVARRLGFTLSTTVEDESVVPGRPPVVLEVWRYPARPRPGEHEG